MENIWERSIKNGADQACPSTFDVIWKSKFSGPLITGILTFLILYWQRPQWVQINDGGGVYEPKVNFNSILFISFFMALISFIIPRYYS